MGTSSAEACETEDKIQRTAGIEEKRLEIASCDQRSALNELAEKAGREGWREECFSVLTVYNLTELLKHSKPF